MAMSWPMVSWSFQSTLSVRRATYVGGFRRVIGLFQSTLSVRRATAVRWLSLLPPLISIHALRKESDPLSARSIRNIIFQSTLSVRRATRVAGVIFYKESISIHALRKESDQTFQRLKIKNYYFNPRSP